MRVTMRKELMSVGHAQCDTAFTVPSNRVLKLLMLCPKPMNLVQIQLLFANLTTTITTTAAFFLWFEIQELI